MHAALVAGESHHLAQPLCRPNHLIGMGGDFRHTAPDMSGDNLRLTQAKAVRLIAAAHLGVFGLKGTDCVGVCHASLMSGWMGWLHRASGADVALKYDP